MKRILFIFILSSAFYNVEGQNLVANPSFEDTIMCPLIGFGGGDCIFFNEGLGQTCSDWHSVGCGSPDYWHTCTGLVPGPNSQGFQYPRTGSAYIGVLTAGGAGCHVREYATSQLSQPLASLTTYYVEFYVSRANANCFPLPSDGLGVLFTVGEADTTGTSNASGTHQTCNPLNYIPQVRNPVGSYITDTVSWVRISGTFTASGGEDHITLGNFADTISFQCGYYWIDDVLVIPDSIIEHYEDVTNNIALEIYPIPFSSNATLSISNKNLTDGRFLLFDAVGRKVMSEKFSGSRLEIHRGATESGIYFYEVKEKGNMIAKGKIMIK